MLVSVLPCPLHYLFLLCLSCQCPRYTSGLHGRISCVSWNPCAQVRPAGGVVPFIDKDAIGLETEGVRIYKSKE